MITNYTNTNQDIYPEDVCNVLSSTIACDDINKTAVFYVMLSARLEEPLNACLVGLSSSGKSFIPKEVALYFPANDVITIADASPTALRYDADYYDDDGIGHVDFENRILLFVEMPNVKALEKLRSILSHDNRTSTFKTTTGGANGARKTQTMCLENYPAVIFCSTYLRINSQEMTRFIVLSPEVSDEKIQKSVEMAAIKNSDPAEYNYAMAHHPGRNFLMNRIREVNALKDRHVVIDDIQNRVIKRYRDLRGKYSVGDTRNIQHLLSLIKSITYLNAVNRINPDTNHITSTQRDIDEGFQLWEKIRHYQGSGLIPVVTYFFENYFLPAYKNLAKGQDGIRIEDVSIYSRKKGISSDWSPDVIKDDFIPAMITQGLIEEMRDPTDKRFKLYRPLRGLSEPHNSDFSETTSLPQYKGPTTKNPGHYDDYGTALSEPSREEEELDF